MEKVHVILDHSVEPTAFPGCAQVAVLARIHGVFRPLDTMLEIPRTACRGSWVVAAGLLNFMLTLNLDLPIDMIYRRTCRAATHSHPNCALRQISESS